MAAVPPSERGIPQETGLPQPKENLFGEMQLTEGEFMRVLFKVPSSAKEHTASKIFQAEVRRLEAEFRDGLGTEIPYDVANEHMDF